MAKTNSIVLQKTSLSLVVVSVTALTLAAMPTWSQTPLNGPGTGTTGTMGMTGNGPGNTGSKPMGMSRVDDSKTARSDRKMMEDLAQGNMGEIDAGKLALEKSQNPDIKQFAQTMVNDHTKALSEVTALAQAKGVTLPDGAGATAKTRATAMKALSGKLFDKEHARHAGVGDHEETVKLLRKIQKSGKDADFTALATKLLPTVERHLIMAKELAEKTS